MLIFVGVAFVSWFQNCRRWFEDGAGTENICSIFLVCFSEHNDRFLVHRFRFSANISLLTN